MSVDDDFKKRIAASKEVSEALKQYPELDKKIDRLNYQQACTENSKTTNNKEKEGR